MAKILIKKSVVPGKVPLTSDLEIGELAVNTADAKLFTKHDAITVKELAPAETENTISDIIRLAFNASGPQENDYVPLAYGPYTYLSKISWANIKATLKTYFDTIYAIGTIPVKATGTELNNGTDDTKFATAKALKDGEFIGIHIGTSAPADTSKLWLDTN